MQLPVLIFNGQRVLRINLVAQLRKCADDRAADLQFIPRLQQAKIENGLRHGNDLLRRRSVNVHARENRSEGHAARHSYRSESDLRNGGHNRARHRNFMREALFDAKTISVRARDTQRRNHTQYEPADKSRAAHCESSPLPQQQRLRRRKEYSRNVKMPKGKARSRARRTPVPEGRPRFCSTRLRAFDYFIQISALRVLRRAIRAKTVFVLLCRGCLMSSLWNFSPGGAAES